MRWLIVLLAFALGGCMEGPKDQAFTVVEVDESTGSGAAWPSLPEGKEKDILAVALDGRVDDGARLHHVQSTLAPDLISYLNVNAGMYEAGTEQWRIEYRGSTWLVSVYTVVS